MTRTKLKQICPAAPGYLVDFCMLPVAGGPAGFHDLVEVVAWGLVEEGTLAVPMVIDHSVEALVAADDAMRGGKYTGLCRLVREDSEYVRKLRQEMATTPEPAPAAPAPTPASAPQILQLSPAPKKMTVSFQTEAVERDVISLALVDRADLGTKIETVVLVDGKFWLADDYAAHLSNPKPL